MQTPAVNKMALKLCPFMQRQCVGDECSLWMQFDREDGVVWQACTFVLDPILQMQIVKEQIRTQATSDKVANALSDGFGGLRKLAAVAMRVRQIDADINHHD